MSQNRSEELTLDFQDFNSMNQPSDTDINGEKFLF